MMYQGRFRVQFVLLLAVAAIVWPVGPACVTASEPRGPWESWETLRLNAKSVPLFSGNVQMRVSVEQGKTHFETRSTAKFFGARIAQNTTLSIMDRETGRPERYESVSKKRRLASASSTSFTRLDLPEPETPVKQINLPKGKRTLIFFRL